MSIHLYAMNGVYGPKASAAAAVPRRGGEAEAHAAAPEKVDSINISAKAALKRDTDRIAKGVMRDVEQYESVYDAKVENIRARLAENTYHVPAQAVADAILARAYGM